MLIGELARRLRVTTRTLRHYESIGLLLPDRVDPLTGYRSYGSEGVVRGVLIEQLKAAGVPLAAIADVLDGAADRDRTLRDRVEQIDGELRRLTTQRDVASALLAGRVGPDGVAVIDGPPATGVVVPVTVPAEQLESGVRTHLQRLRRRVRRQCGEVEVVLAARFPMEYGDPVAVEVAALSPALREVAWAPYRAVRAAWVGPYSTLALAYDQALTEVERSSMVATGVVQETYLGRGASPLTHVDVLLDAS